MKLLTTGALVFAMGLLAGCGKGGDGGVAAKDEYMKKTKNTEAELQLHNLGKHAKVAYVENAEFPRGSTGVTPAADCCAGPNHKCAVDLGVWKGPWEALDFDIEEPSYFQYSYESADGQSFTAKAIGDLDCDGTKVEWVLTGKATGGNPTVELVSPATAD
jgi:hypothetical protein